MLGEEGGSNIMTNIDKVNTLPKQAKREINVFVIVSRHHSK